MESLAEVEDGDEPVPEAALTLLPRQDDAVAEYQLRVVHLRAVRQSQDEQLKTSRQKEKLLRINHRRVSRPCRKSPNCIAPFSFIYQFRSYFLSRRVRDAENRARLVYDGDLFENARNIDRVLMTVLRSSCFLVSFSFS